MSRFGFNLLLAIAWCLLAGSFTAWNFLGGLVIGATILSLHGQATGRRPYLRRLVSLTRFAAYFFVILVKSNLQIAREVITPGYSMKPRIIRYPVGHLSYPKKTTLANAITLTPGTLAVDVSPDGEYLYLHCMYAEDRARQVADIDELAERLDRWVFA